MIVLDTKVVFGTGQADAGSKCAGMARSDSGPRSLHHLGHGCRGCRWRRAISAPVGLLEISRLKRIIDVEFAERILPFDLAAAQAYGGLRARREHRGRPINHMDAMIAAICLVHDATLASRNIRDFDGLDLELVNPFEAGA